MVCGTFASFAIGDMLIHNRRKRKEWLEEQQRKSAIALEEAREAAALGRANDDQILLLNRERAAQEAEATRKANKGIFTRTKEAIVGGTPEVEEKGGRIMAEVRAAQQKASTTTSAASQQASGVIEDVNSGVSTAVAKAKEAIAPQVTSLTGGPLDRQAQASTDAITGRSRNLYSWITGR